ncbi:S-adenosyl-L-methionine-dependent methyltransferase [Hyaloraphidium curvatum]|nr:S-adenosyl-L-methionine-dependent methyltransferase [Hyaloraphidium curvatum]
MEYPPSVQTLLPRALAVIAAACTSGKASVLEVGCGEGRFAKAVCAEMARKDPNASFTYLAVDPFPGAIEKAKAGSLPANLEFREADLLSVTEGLGTFDVVIMMRSLHHVFPLEDGIRHVHALLAPSGIFLADEFAREGPTEAAATFLFDRVDMLRAALPESARKEGAHGHSHGPRAEAGHSHAHGGAGGHSHGGGAHTHSHGGHGHSERGSHELETDHDVPDATPANLSYVHGTKSHVGVRDDGLPREGTPNMAPLDRWKRVITHDPPLPTSDVMISGLEAVFGKANLEVVSGLPGMYLMATMRMAENVATAVGKVVIEQEKKAIAAGQFEGIGLIFVAKKAA